MLALTVAALAAFSFACVAQAGDIADNQYQGRVEKTPGSYFGFNVKKQHGVKRVKRVAAYLPYHCRGQTEPLRVYSEADGSLKLKPDGSFAGKLKATQFLGRGGTGPRGTYELEGKIGDNGVAKGRIDANLRVNQARARGGSSLRCYSGGLDWKAKEGAEVGLPG